MMAQLVKKASHRADFFDIIDMGDKNVKKNRKSKRCYRNSKSGYDDTKRPFVTKDRQSN